MLCVTWPMGRERNKLYLMFFYVLVGKSVQESEAGTPEREEDRKQPRSPVDDATQCS